MDERTRWLIRAAELKAARLGISATEYLAGIIEDRYPLITREEIEAVADGADDDAIDPSTYA